MLPRLFSPFEQAPQDIARSSGGLGLGLALVDGIVKLHSGQVSAESDGPGTGARFLVRLPRIGPPCATREQPPNDAAALRILVIEDNVDAARVLAELLQLQDHQVWVATDGPTGITLAHEHTPDVILCDIGLPGMSGYDVAKALRSSPDLGGTRLIALSGYGQPDARDKSADAGFETHLVKPVDLATLERLLAASGH